MGPTMRSTLLILPVKVRFGVKVLRGMSPSSSSRGTVEGVILETSAARAATPRRPWRMATLRASDLEGAKVCRQGGRVVPLKSRWGQMGGWTVGDEWRGCSRCL